MYTIFSIDHTGRTLLTMSNDSEPGSRLEHTICINYNDKTTTGTKKLDLAVSTALVGLFLLLDNILKGS
jgi:hypothetical protein